MKIKFADRLTGGVTQEPLRAINPSTAPLRLVAELQMETGWDLKTFRENGATMYTFAMAAWLTLHNAGFTVTWDQVADLAMDDMEFIEEPGDLVAAGQADTTTEADASEPASPDSNPDAAPEPATPKARPRSKRQSPGSSAKSANDSPTS